MFLYRSGPEVAEPWLVDCGRGRNQRRGASSFVAEVSVKEQSNLLESFLGFRRVGVPIILPMRLSLEHLQYSLDTSLPQLTVDQDSVTEKEIACASREYCGWEPLHITKDGR